MMMEEEEEEEEDEEEEDEEDEEEEEEEEEEDKKPEVTFKDIRRYYCHFCGICRSKKSLISSHIVSHHKEKILEEENEGEQGKPSSTICEECDISFTKPAHLKQHMQSHSIERPFACTVDDCHQSYRRKDHLTRHLLKHQGKLFMCPRENCNHKFVYQANAKRHVKEQHDEEDPICDGDNQKLHVCPEVGCGKTFKYPSKLRKHEESHVKLDYVEAACCEPGCMKRFSNIDCLKAHLRSSHQYIKCEVCGSQQLKKNIKRHLRSHESIEMVERIKCHFKRCQYTFSTKSNLKQHIKSVHLELRPFVCRVSGCGKAFPYRHVRDNHEKSGLHVYTQGDFVESDEQFRSRPRGGRKRKSVTVETLLRKTDVPVDRNSGLDNGTEYLSWLLSEDQ